jgi:hypothetical protein
MSRNLTEVDMLSEEEQKWLNEYHQVCEEEVGNLLGDDERARKWLKAQCQPY